MPDVMGSGFRQVEALLELADDRFDALAHTLQQPHPPAMGGALSYSGVCRSMLSVSQSALNCGEYNPAER